MASDVYELTLAGPARNALGTAFMEDIRTRLRAAAGRPVLLAGSNGAFSAGLNLKEVAALDRSGMARFLDLLEALVEEVYCYPGPLVAAVNGHAIAGGCVLALCCDHRVMADDPALRIGLNEVAIGLQFPPKIFTVVRRRVAPQSVERVVLEAGLYDPHTGLRLGLVDEIATDPIAAARAHLERLAAHPRQAFTATKRALRGAAIPVSDDEQRRFRDELVPAWSAPEAKQRVTDRLTRR
ncbi:MAG: enoyl-CoA hydratase/isomerase family protein [Candidatus Binatia bacterium]